MSIRSPHRRGLARASIVLVTASLALFGCERRTPPEEVPAPPRSESPVPGNPSTSPSPMPPASAASQ